MATDIDGETLQRHLPEGPLTSLRRIQAAYGALAEAAGQKGGDPRYSIYYTPGALDEFVANERDEDRYLAVVEVDLTADGIDADDVSVSIERLTADLVQRLGFARYPWGRAIDHSITRRGAKSGSDAEQVATYLVECLERWTNATGREPAVGETAVNHPDGWVIDALQALGTDETVTQAIEADVDRLLTGSPRVTATVKVRVDPADLEERPGRDADGPVWVYPGEIDVLNAAMKARKDEKLARKNLNDGDDSSRGRGVCMVSDEETEVFGTTEDPLAHFTVQHTEKFANFERSQAWRSHPVSSDVALLLQSGTSFVEACETTRNGLGVFTLPYFLSLNEERALLLFRALRRLEEREFEASNEHPMRFVERVVEEQGDEADLEHLRFHVISRRNDSGDISVFHEVPDATLYWPRLVADTYESVLGSTAFDDAAGFDTDEEWSLLSAGRDSAGFLNDVVSGSFAWNAVPERGGEDGATADDPVEWYTYRLLTGADIPVERLLTLFVDRLAEEREDDPENRLSTKHLTVQFAQLTALAEAGLLAGSGQYETLTTPQTTMELTSDDLDRLREESGSVSIPVARRIRLEQFIESRDALADAPERRGAFLIGVLVGQLSHHQATVRDMNRTLRDQHQAENMTAGKMAELYRELIDKAGIYASEADWGSELLFEETVDAVTDTLSVAVPTDWILSRQDLQFFYALGVGYGSRAESRAFDLKERIEAEAEPTAN